MPATPPEPHRTPSSLDWLERLIRFDTVSRNSNLGLIETVRDHCSGLGLTTQLTYDAASSKANLFATLPASDGRITGGAVLSGHTDVVPVDGQNWQSDPFSPVVREGRLYGRGSADMKGFIAVVMNLLPQIARTPLREPLHIALSFDEEVGCRGAPLMLADLQARGIHPQSCLVGEPTSMQVVVAHKGINLHKCTVRGRAAHSSLTPRGVNAIEYAARLICFIRDLTDRMQQTGPFDTAFDVPFTTGQTSLIQGGVAINTIPELCEFSFEFRNLPGVDSQGILAQITDHAQNVLLPRMREHCPEAEFLVEKIAAVPAFEAAEQAEATRLLRALRRDDQIRKVAYCTEAGQFQQAGIPAVICGPGDIEQAHRVDEFVELEQIRECEEFLAQFAASLRN
jgi:acetylornithine deacetylase